LSSYLQNIILPKREDDRDYFLGQINKFYDKFPDGPQSVITKILKVYEEHCFQERSLSKVHQEAQQEVVYLSKNPLIIQIETNERE